MMSFAFFSAISFVSSSILLRSFRRRALPRPPSNQEGVFGVFGGHAGDFLKPSPLRLYDGVDPVLSLLNLFLLLRQRGLFLSYVRFLPLDAFELFIETFLFLLDALFKGLGLGSPLLELGVELAPRIVKLAPCLVEFLLALIKPVFSPESRRPSLSSRLLFLSFRLLSSPPLLPLRRPFSLHLPPVSETFFLIKMPSPAPMISRAKPAITIMLVMFPSPFFPGFKLL